MILFDGWIGAKRGEVCGRWGCLLGWVIGGIWVRQGLWGFQALLLQTNNDTNV
jgi:hypothetical protein